MVHSRQKFGCQWSNMSSKLGAELEQKFATAYETWGFLAIPSLESIIDPDESTTFVPATISTFRSLAQQPHAIPNPGGYTEQDCLRTQNFTGMLQATPESLYADNYVWSSFFKMLGTISAIETQPSWHPWKFLTEILQIPAERIVIDVASADKDLFDFPPDQQQSVVADMREGAKYRWEFGNTWVNDAQELLLVGTGLTFLIKDYQNPTTLHAIGNVILLHHALTESNQTTLVGSEFAIGTGTTTYALKKDEKPNRLLGIQEAILPFLENSDDVQELQFFESLTTAVALLHYGIRSNNHTDLHSWLQKIYPEISPKFVDKKVKEAIALYRKCLKVAVLHSGVTKSIEEIIAFASEIDTQLFGGSAGLQQTLTEDIEYVKTQYTKSYREFEKSVRRKKTATADELYQVGIGNGILPSDIATIIKNQLLH